MQEHAARHGLIVVAPDTSPRGDGVADDAAYDLGQGASFYVNATQEPWSRHYRLQDYIVRELPALIEHEFPASTARGISGHSMGGHGALITALRNPGRYQSVSAFSPIVAPTQVPWGVKALTAYLGPDREKWQEWDTCELVMSGHGRNLHLLIDQGGSDEFLESQLQPHRLAAACEAAGVECILRMQDVHDHSYYFIGTFIGEHVAHHAKTLAIADQVRDPLQILG